MLSVLSLPIDAYLGGIVETLRGSGCLVLVAEPGAGKTTRVPPGIVRDGGLSADAPAVVMLQPRRIAARAAAERIAEEMGETVGGAVGYQVRYERRITDKTVIRVVTEAILTRQLLGDPSLPGVGCVILDEFHERSIHSDIALALLREVQQTIRPDLKIVVMSATLDAGQVSRFLGGCPVVSVPGRVFPVEVEYLGSGGRMNDVVEETARAVQGVLGREGNVLCFLPGAGEIAAAMRLLAPIAQGSDVLPLHGSLPFEDQRRAIAPSARRKIVLATNIAETSLTIDGIRTVIDSGLARQAGFDPARGAESLRLGWISQASAAQRAGRAGRTAPGKCVRLWSARQQHALNAFELAEIHRIDLSGTLLMLLAWGMSSAAKFGWFEPPGEERVTASLLLLARLGLVKEGRITETGRRAAPLPLHPRLGAMLVRGVEAGAAERAATLAALLSERDIRMRDASVSRRSQQVKEISDSDVLGRVELLEYAEKRGFDGALYGEGVDVNICRQVCRARDELLKRAGSRSSSRAGSRPAAPRRGDTLTSDTALLLAAYPDRVCRRRESDPAAGIMVGGVGLTLSPEVSVRKSELFLAVAARDDERAMARQAIVEMAHAVTLQELEAANPAALEQRTACVYDTERQRVAGRKEFAYYDLVLESTDDGRVEDGPAAQAMAEALLPRMEALMSAEAGAVELLARIRVAERFLKAGEGREWPGGPWDRYDEELKGFLIGKRKLSEVSFEEFVRTLLVYPMDRALEQEVPTHFTVPTGNRIRIDYSGPAPALSVRLQEMFGVTKTPAIAGGRLPLVIHLLSPGYKPVQVTQDLESFWQNTYARVKKDLKARYPRHAWPDDPLLAVPVAKGRATRGPGSRG